MRIDSKFVHLPLHSHPWELAPLAGVVEEQILESIHLIDPISEVSEESDIQSSREEKYQQAMGIFL